MVWTSIWPVGTSSVKGNKAAGVANTAYIETTMNVDHYWNDSGNTDGHHKFVQMPKTGTAAVPADATLATGMSGNIYLKTKSTTESPDNQDVQPFFINNEAVDVAGVTQISQLLGIRACCCFNVSGGVVTIKYAQNIASVVKVSPGIFTATFTNSLPSVNYLVQGGGATSGGTQHIGVVWQVRNEALTTTKTASALQFATTVGGTAVDPLQCWFVCFGG